MVDISGQSGFFTFTDYVGLDTDILALANFNLEFLKSIFISGNFS